MGLGQGSGRDHLISLSMEDAFSAYEAVRHRLPAARPGNRDARQIETLEEIAQAFDVFLLDAFGVLNIGETAIPGTRERIEQLRQQGKRVLVVSNAASVPPSALLTKYRGLGYQFDLEDIVTSRSAMVASLQDRNEILWGVMGGAAAVAEDLGDLQTVLLKDDPDAYRNASGFLLVGSGGWTEHRQKLLESALKTAPRPVLVANPDIVAPRETGFSAEPGHFAHRLADSAGIKPHFFGKPFGNIYDLAFSRLGEVDKSRVLMVGDSLHTDILGAQAAGLPSALITQYGFLAGHDAAWAIKQSGILPDFMVKRP